MELYCIKSNLLSKNKNAMKFCGKCIIGLVIILSVGNHAAAQNAAKYVQDLQQQRFTAMIQKDTLLLETNIDEGLVYIHSNGLVQTKKTFIASVASGSILYHSIEQEEQQLRMYKQTAIINGIVHVKGSLNGTAFDVRLRYTDVYVKKKKWCMASWQSLKL